MTTERKVYAQEFKLEAVRLSLEDGRKVTDVASELGIRSKMLYRWRKEYPETNGQSFPGQGKAGNEEMAELKQELARVKEERDILKRALVFFSRESK